MKKSIDLHVVGSLVVFAIAVVETFAAKEHAKINLLVIKRSSF